MFQEAEADISLGQGIPQEGNLVRISQDIRAGRHVQRDLRA